jgi:uroporphyrinogen decarboxylase
MTPEKKLYAALEGRQQALVPTLSTLIDANTVNQVLGTRPIWGWSYFGDPRAGKWVDRLAGPISRLVRLGARAAAGKVAEANYRLGFDGVLVTYWPGKVLNHTEAEDVFGRLFRLEDDGFGNPYQMFIKGLIDSPEAWRRYPRPDIGEYARTLGKLYRELRRTWNERIAVVPFIGPGPWENSWQPLGFTRFVKMMRRDPGFAREVAGYYAALTDACVEACCAAGSRVVQVGDDLAYRSGPMLSPVMLEEFYGEGYRRMTATAHRYGAKIIFHCCGNTRDLLEKIIDWGFDGAHAFEPPAGNDLAAARASVGDRLCLVGNIDITHTLFDASREEVESEVASAVRGAQGGGFILAPAHSHPSINVRNVRWMLEASKKAD